MTSASTRGGQAFHVRPESTTKGQAACSSCKMPSWYDLTFQLNTADPGTLAVTVSCRVPVLAKVRR
jgi:hypothetical protein